MLFGIAQYYNMMFMWIKLFQFNQMKIVHIFWCLSFLLSFKENALWSLKE